MSVSAGELGVIELISSNRSSPFTVYGHLEPSERTIVPTFTPPSFLLNRKKSIAVLTSFLVLFAVAANGAGVLNTPSSGGYFVCAKPENRVITHFANSKTAKCPKGFNKVSIGAQGIKGVPGLTGATGLSGSNGKDGKDGKTLWNGIKDPESSWGAPGDMFINSTTKTLFGPKNLDGTWPTGVSMVGPKGDQGPIGLTGATGPQGPGGSGPAGPAGATGATGPAGAAGANGTNGTNGTNGVDGTSGTGFTISRQANITVDNADTQWESFIEVVKMSGLGNGKYFFNSSVAINNATNVLICYVYGGSTPAGDLSAYGMNTSTIAQTGYIEISGSNDFISLRCGKTAGSSITVQFPVITAIKLDSVTVKNS